VTVLQKDFPFMPDNFLFKPLTLAGLNDNQCFCSWFLRFFGEIIFQISCSFSNESSYSWCLYLWSFYFAL